MQTIVTNGFGRTVNVGDHALLVATVNLIRSVGLEGQSMSCRGNLDHRRWRRGFTYCWTHLKTFI